jgi:uncharacterized protein (DUF488 family)
MSIWREGEMTVETIQKVQAYLTVRQNGSSKKIMDVETLLRRHGHGQVLSLLMDLMKEKQKRLVHLMQGDRSIHEIDEVVTQMFRLHMAIKVIEREMEVKETCPS